MVSLNAFGAAVSFDMVPCDVEHSGKQTLSYITSNVHVGCALAARV